MNRILHVQAKPVFGWCASLVVSLALTGAAALTGWWLAGPPAATGLSPPSGPVPDLTQALVWPAAVAKDAPAATWRQQPRPPDRRSRLEPPDTRARNGDVIYALDTPEMNDIGENSMISLMQQTQIGLNIYRNGTLVALRHALNAEEEPAPAEQR